MLRKHNDVNLDSDGVYDLKTVPDVLGLHARRPEAAVVKMLLGCDSRSLSFGPGCESA